MRNALNNNPIAQIAIVGVLLVVGALLVSGGLMKKDSGSTEATVDTGTAAVPEAGSPAATAGAPTGAATAAAPGSSGLPVVEGPPLPRSVRSAYQGGKVVVLLVVRAGGADDKLVRSATLRLRSVPGLEVFTTKARGIARYTQITQGVGVNRVPALVVVRPRDLGSGVATAEVRYGFHSAQSIVQAVRDALYRGPTLSYSPR
jgi:hypothetical protein